MWPSTHKGQIISADVQLLRGTKYCLQMLLQTTRRVILEWQNRYSCIQRNAYVSQADERELKVTAYARCGLSETIPVFYFEWKTLIWQRSCRTAHFFWKKKKRFYLLCYISQDLNLFNLVLSMFLRLYFLLSFTYL